MSALTFDPDAMLARRSPPKASSPTPAPLPTLGYGVAVDMGDQMPLAWRRGLARLEEMPAPRAARPARWQQIVDDTLGFMRTHWAKAVHHGWSDGALFGFDADNYDGDVCLTMALRGGEILLLDAASAIIVRAGTRFIYRPCIPGDAPLIWTLR